MENRSDGILRSIVSLSATSVFSQHQYSGVRLYTIPVRLNVVYEESVLQKTRKL